AVVIEGPLQDCYLKTAARKLIARHEILRTTFQRLPGMTIPMQVIEETGSLTWYEDDLTGIDDQGSLVETFFLVASPALDLALDPFLYLQLIKRAKNDYCLILCLPAICADPMGLRSLVGELSRSYNAAVCGEDLNDDLMQYADLAEWQNELLE